MSTYIWELQRWCSRRNGWDWWACKGWLHWTPRPGSARSWTWEAGTRPPWCRRGSCWWSPPCPSCGRTWGPGWCSQPRRDRSGAAMPTFHPHTFTKSMSDDPCIYNTYRKLSMESPIKLIKSGLQKSYTCAAKRLFNDYSIIYSPSYRLQVCPWIKVQVRI